MPKGLKIPANPAEAAALLFTLRAKRYDLQHLIDDIEADEKALKASIVEKLTAKGMSGVAGSVCRVELTEKQVAKVSDWSKFYAYIAKNKAWELLQKRPSEAAVAERWAAGKAVPGVDAISVPFLGIHKV